MEVENLEAIILLGHGSRVKGAGEQMEAVAQSLQRKYGFKLVKTCYLSRLGPHFPEVLQEVVESGAKEIITIPYFLHGGMHILLDIPQMMQIEAEKYPQVKLILGKNLGFDELLVDLLHKRIGESHALTDVRNLQLPPRDRYPVPEGQCEFVPMKPEEAEKYRHVHGDDDHHHH